MRHLRCIARWMTALVLASFGAAQAAITAPLPDDFVMLRALAPDIQQDIRYAGRNNFVGRPLPGYDGAECVVKRAVAHALQKVQQALAQHMLSLKMLDCYRPARAVHDMVIWAQDGVETPAQKRYNPAFSKRDLFRLGYIAQYSGHSTGAALDLTLVDLRAAPSVPFDPGKSYADCTAPEALRAPEGS